MPKCVSNLKSVSVVVKCCIAHCWMSGLQLRLAPFSCICCPPIFRPDNVQALFMAAPCFPCLDSIYEWFLPELTKIERICEFSGSYGANDVGEKSDIISIVSETGRKMSPEIIILEWQIIY